MDHTVDKKQVLLVFFFFFGLSSFEIRSRLQKCFTNYIPYRSLNVVCQSENRTANVFNFKDIVNTKLISHVIYKFLCSCCKAPHYGQTL